MSRQMKIVGSFKMENKSKPPQMDRAHTHGVVHKDGRSVR